MKLMLAIGFVVLCLILTININAINHTFLPNEYDKKFLCQLFNSSQKNNTNYSNNLIPAEIFASQCDKNKNFCFASQTTLNHNTYNTGIIECNTDLSNCFFYFPPPAFSKNLSRDYFSCKQV